LCRLGIVHPAKNLPRELGKMMGVVVAMGRKKAYNKTINRVRSCALSAASTGSCAADEGKTRGAWPASRCCMDLGADGAVCGPVWM